MKEPKHSILNFFQGYRYCEGAPNPYSNLSKAPTVGLCLGDGMPWVCALKLRGLGVTGFGAFRVQGPAGVTHRVSGVLAVSR